MKEAISSLKGEERISDCFGLLAKFDVDISEKTKLSAPRQEFQCSFLVKTEKEIDLASALTFVESKISELLLILERAQRLAYPD